MIGTTPAKPEFEQSELKDKQNHRFYMNEGFEIHNVPYSYRLERDINLGSPSFQRPENKEELFAGRVPAQGQHIGDLGDLLGESDDKFSHRPETKAIFGYMLTDNTSTMNKANKRRDVEGDQQTYSQAVASYMKSNQSQARDGVPSVVMNNPRKYTLGQSKQDDQQITMPSLTQ